MVINSSKHTRKTPVPQASRELASKPNKINATTPYNFAGKDLTPYGGLFPVATMLEKLGFRNLVEETLTVSRMTRFMPAYEFLLAIVLSLYVGFFRLSHIRYVSQDPLLTGILKVTHLPPQSTFWRFLASLHLGVAPQVLQVQRKMRERVWAAANVRLTAVTLDTDTTVHTVYGKQMGARKSYNPKNKGKKSFQPILTFIAETREYVWGELRNGDRPDGKQIARHLEGACASLPPCVKTIYARADSGFYCWDAMEAYEKHKVQFIVVARKTPRLVEELEKADWKPSRKTDADEQCEFWYQPEGWAKPYRFIALRYRKNQKRPEEREQYQLFDTPRYIYRVFVTSMKDAIDLLVWVYNGRAGAENLIKEANNDAGLAAHPSGRWRTNCVHFQLALVAYNLNCWLMLFNREEEAKVDDLRHTTLATARLRFLFLAARVWRHSGRKGISYSDHYEEQGLFHRLMKRLRGIAFASAGSFLPVVAKVLAS
jgi:Transposase DDE domain group 1